MDDSRLQPLTDLLLDEGALPAVAQLAGGFNLFEAMGATHQELRHSNFLAFLLNPSGAHGLGDRFTRLFLRKALENQPNSRGSDVLRLLLADLGSAVVYREWNWTDILIVDKDNQIVALVENKVRSAEGVDQLAGYYEQVKNSFSECKIIPVLLSPEGLPPSHPEYGSISYAEIDALLAELLSSATLSQPLELVTTHYQTLIRRHVLKDTDIAELCRQVYVRHKVALDLIFEHRPDIQVEIKDFIVGNLLKNPVVAPEKSSKYYVRFALPAWDLAVLHTASDGWGHSKRILLFEFENLENRLDLVLTVGRGDEAARQNLRRIAEAGPPFKLEAWNAYPRLYRRSFLSADDLQVPTLGHLADKLRATWEDWVGSELPIIRDALLNDPWVRASPPCESQPSP